jgi:hypothetical protein
VFRIGSDTMLPDDGGMKDAFFRAEFDKSCAEDAALSAARERQLLPVLH